MANHLENIHNNAKLYLTGEQGIYPVTIFMEMEDVGFNKSGLIRTISATSSALLIAHGETLLRN